MHDFELLTFTGAHVISYLQTKLTADTRTWSDGQVHYSTIANINGQMLGDAWAWVDGARTYMIVPGSHAEPVATHLDRYVIMEDVVIERAPFHGWALGEAVTVADDVPYRVGACSFVPGATGLLWAADASAEALSAHVDALVGANKASRVGAQALAMVQIDAGVAAFGVDLVPLKTIPLEAGLWHGISLNKGCYLGQEIIERLYSRGRPNKRLMHLSWPGAAMEAGAELINDSGKAMGHITRSYESGGTAHALGYVKRKALEDRDIALTIAGAAVTVGAYAGGEAPPK
ncbi:MAG: folate-binding protein YgfZ [Bradymonadia bacterium]|jgi:folate-binding protein YgfZ